MIGLGKDLRKGNSTPKGLELEMSRMCPKGREDLPQCNPQYSSTFYVILCHLILDKKQNSCTCNLPRISPCL